MCNKMGPIRLPKVVIPLRTRVNPTMDHLLQTVQQVVRYDWRPKNEEMTGGS